MFPRIPGSYNLPFSEGSFIIQGSAKLHTDGCGTVQMLTSGSGVTYYHDLVDVESPSWVADFG